MESERKEREREREREREARRSEEKKVNALSPREERGTRPTNPLPAEIMPARALPRRSWKSCAAGDEASKGVTGASLVTVI